MSVQKDMVLPKEDPQFVNPDWSLTVGDTARGPCGHTAVCYRRGESANGPWRRWRHKSRLAAVVCALRGLV